MQLETAGKNPKQNSEFIKFIHKKGEIIMNTEKIKEVFADEAFVKGLFELESVAEVQTALKEKGVELTEEEILGIRQLLDKVESGEISAEQVEQWAKQAESGELSDDMLELVSGGSVLIAIGVGAAIVAGAALIGCVINIGFIRNRW